MKLPDLSSNRWLVLGRAGLDIYADPPGTRIEQAGAFFPALGGSAANIAVGIVKLGGAASLLTTLSNDAVGRYVYERLKGYGVLVDHVRFVGGETRTSLAVVATRNDDTETVIYRNGAADFALAVDDARAVDFASYAGLIATGTSLAAEPSRAAAFLAADMARASGLALLFDIDYRAYSWESAAAAAQICRRFADLSDIVIGNDEEFALLAGGGDGQRLAAAFAAKASAAIYKMGAGGARTFAGERVIDTGIYPVKPLKPTGAGDAFLAGLSTGLALGLALPDCLRRGAAAAAIVVTRVGCAPASPGVDELEAFMAQHEIAPQV